MVGDLHLAYMIEVFGAGNDITHPTGWSCKCILLFHVAQFEYDFAASFRYKFH
jgi:hypothetical protein